MSDSCEINDLYHGVVYLIQPSEYIDKIKDQNKYKIGVSYKVGSGRIKAYKPRTKIYGVHYIKDVFNVEKKLKRGFNLHFKLFRGYEYFEGNLSQMIEIYWNVIESYLVKQDNHNPKPNKDVLIDLDKYQINLKLIKKNLKNSLFRCKNCSYKPY